MHANLWLSPWYLSAIFFSILYLCLLLVCNIFCCRYDCSRKMFKSVKRSDGCVDCSGKANLCTRDFTNSLRRATHVGDETCDSADSDTPHNFYCPKFNYDVNDCDNAKGFVSAFV